MKSNNLVELLPHTTDEDKEKYIKILNEVDKAIEQLDHKILTKDTRAFFETLVDTLNIDASLKFHRIIDLTKHTPKRKVSRSKFNIYDFLKRNTAFAKDREEYNAVLGKGTKLYATDMFSLYVIDMNKKVDGFIGTILKKQSDAVYKETLQKMENNIIKQFYLVEDVYFKDFNLNELINKLKFAFEMDKALVKQRSCYNSVKLGSSQFSVSRIYKALKLFNDMNAGIETVNLQVNANGVLKISYGENSVYIFKMIVDYENRNLGLEYKF